MRLTAVDDGRGAADPVLGNRLRGLVERFEALGGEVAGEAGEAGDGRAAIEVIAAARPDVVLPDLGRPRYDGIWTLERLRERGVETPVLVLTTFNDDTLVLQALRAGARGYLLKDVTLEQLPRAVRTLAEGYANREIARALFLAEGTVKNHVSTILLKLDARDRTNAVLRAPHEGILR